MTTKEQIHSLVDTLEGWCGPKGDFTKADALHELVLKTKPKLIVEIGTFAGKTLFCMALPAKEIGGCTVISIDPWDNEASAAGQVEQVSEEWWRSVNHELIYRKFLYQVDKLGLKDIIEVHRLKSIDMEPPKNVDILHLDGNHGPDAVQDAERFAPNVKLGGYCVLDDLGWTGGYVKLAEKHILSIGFSKVKGNDDWAIYQRMEMGAPKVAEKAADVRNPLPTIEDNLDSKLTVAFITSRENSCANWFLDSLRNTGLKPAQIIIVDLHEDVARNAKIADFDSECLITPPKPTIWQGKHRITKQDWWAASNARNTALCLCKTEWLACVDDRCVIMPGWAEAVREAIKGKYVLCGSYQKRVDMKVEGGFIVEGGTVIGEDHRFLNHPTGLIDCPGEWTFGCNFVVPVEWALEVNGQEELCDSLSMEDVFFGKMLANCGHPIKFSAAMRIIEDRTPSELGTPMKRTDKGISPADKSHAAVRKFSPLKRTLHPWNLAEIRKTVLAGGEWPSVEQFPSVDWYDQQPHKEFK